MATPPSSRAHAAPPTTDQTQRPTRRGDREPTRPTLLSRPRYRPGNDRLAPRTPPPHPRLDLDHPSLPDRRRTRHPQPPANDPAPATSASTPISQPDVANRHHALDPRRPHRQRDPHL